MGQRKEEGETGLDFRPKQRGEHEERKNLGKKADNNRHLRRRGVYRRWERAL